MIMTRGQIYRCQNRDCRCEIAVVNESIEASVNPRCCCGAEMKRPYQKPTFRTLDRFEMEILAGDGSARDRN